MTKSILTLTDEELQNLINGLPPKHKVSFEGLEEHPKFEEMLKHKTDLRRIAYIILDYRNKEKGKGVKQSLIYTPSEETLKLKKERLEVEREKLELKKRKQETATQTLAVIYQSIQRIEEKVDRVLELILKN